MAEKTGQLSSPPPPSPFLLSALSWPQAAPPPSPPSLAVQEGNQYWNLCHRLAGVCDGKAAEALMLPQSPLPNKPAIAAAPSLISTFQSLGLLPLPFSLSLSHSLSLTLSLSLSQSSRSSLSFPIPLSPLSLSLSLSLSPLSLSLSLPLSLSFSLPSPFLSPLSLPPLSP